MLKFLLPVFVDLILLTVAVIGQDGTSYCNNPIVESQNIVDLKFIHENYKSGWNTQFGNAVFLKQTARILQGTDTPVLPADNSEMCLKVSLDFLNEHYMFGYIKGSGGLTAEWNCTDLNHIYDCHFYSPKNNYSFAAKLFLVYFDGNKGHNSNGIALCESDGTVGWHVNSISKKLTDEETEMILNRFKTVGFEPSVRIPLRSENCQ